jgi:acetyl esterase/lipase
MVRGSRVAYSLTSILAAWLFWTWPDAASVVVAVMFSLTLMYIGIALLAKGVRHHFPAGRGSRRRTQATLIVQVVGSALALALVSSAIFGTVRIQSDSAAVDEFYTWERDIPETPGRVLRVEDYEGTAPEGSHALRILYSTTRSDGSPALASAVIAYPTDDGRDPRTVLAWQHGTTGVAQACGPSLRPDALTELAIPGISQAISRGWVVVATDYPGQGTPGRYPYLIGEGEGRATLDAIRAVGQIPEAKASRSAWVWGHSQGGHATLWAGQIAQRYAPELELLGVAALSAASDPLVLAEKIAGPGAHSAIGDVVTSFVLVPYVDEYSDITLAATVHPVGQGIVETFASRCVSDGSLLVSVLTAMTFGLDAPLYRLDLHQGPVHSRLSENIADGMVPMPLFLGQGTDDETIPIKMQRDLSNQLCAIGRTVETHEYPGKTHMSVIEQGSPLIGDLYTWADAVYSGATPTNCDT